LAFVREIREIVNRVHEQRAFDRRQSFVRTELLAQPIDQVLAFLHGGGDLVFVIEHKLNALEDRVVARLHGFTSSAFLVSCSATV
jgi:hypothetical protein